MSKKKNKKKNRNPLASWAAGIRDQYCAQGHGKAFQGEISDALSNAFQERWGNDTEGRIQRPLIAEVKGFQLEFETNALDNGGKCRVCFRAPYIIDYHGIYAERHECVCFRLDTKAPADILVEKIREQEGAILEKIRKGVSQLPDVFPEAFIGDTKIPRQFAAVSFVLTQVDYRKRGEVDFDSILAKIKFQRVEMGRAVSSELMARIQKSLCSMETLPENARPITKVDCVIDLTTDSIFSYFIIAKYHVFFKGYNRDRYIKISIPIPGLFPIFREKNAAAKDDIAAIFQREAVAAFDRAYENLPYYRLEPPEILQSALNYGRQDGIQFGKIRARCEYILSGMEKTTFYPGEQDLIGAATWENGKIIREDNVLSLRKLEKKMAEPVKIKSKKGLPNDPISFINFCKEAAALYDGFKDKRVPVMPDLTFVFNEEKGNACFCNKVRIDLSGIFDAEKTYEKTVRARVLDVFAHVADLEFARLNRAKEQTKILSELNPTELLILKHISGEGNTSPNCDWLHSKISSSRKGTLHRLHSFCWRKPPNFELVRLPAEGIWLFAGSGHGRFHLDSCSAQKIRRISIFFKETHIIETNIQ